MPDLHVDLHVGDTVIWSGAWGYSPPETAKVIEMEYTGGAKYGRPVDSAPWSKLSERNYIVTLDNGCWAWDYQLRPYEDPHV